MACFDMAQNQNVKINKLKEGIIAAHKAALAKAPAAVKATYDAWLEKVNGLIKKGVPAQVDKLYKWGGPKGGEEDHVHVLRFVGTDVVVPVYAAEYQKVTASVNAQQGG